MKQSPRISEAEWEVMKVVWGDSPLSAYAIVQHLERSFSWSPKTVRTLISRLVQKGALGYREKGRAYDYFPLVGEEECMKAERQSFLKKIYGGSLKPMLVHFLQEEQLTAGDIEELKRLLEKKRSPESAQPSHASGENEKIGD